MKVATSLVIHLQDVDVVGEALIAEHRGPFIEWRVGCNDDRAALVTLAEGLKQRATPR